MKMNKIKLSKAQLDKIKFVSTQSHGYLLVPTNIMDQFPEIKKKISEFSWIKNDTFYLEEDADVSLFVYSLGINSNDIKEISTEKEIEEYEEEE
jgi:hypothetical protein